MTMTSPEMRFAKPSRETVKCDDASPAARRSTGGKGGSNRTSSYVLCSDLAADSLQRAFACCNQTLAVLLLVARPDGRVEPITGPASARLLKAHGRTIERKAAI